MKKWIPNLITLLNLFSGCIAALFAFQNDLMMAGFFVGLGIFFDFFDGLAARLLKVSSELGTQLDSLADMVTSGLVPGIVMYQMFYNSIGVGFFDVHRDYLPWSSDHVLAHPYLPLFGFLITLASCYRLAKFNIDTRQTDSFIGLPTPANAILIISTGIILQTTTLGAVDQIIGNPFFLIALTLISCFLLNAELPLFALKFKKFNFKGNEIRYIFLIAAVAMIAALKIYAVPCIIILYILMSVFVNLKNKKATIT
jgi:CDP-diacylglycerol--serine O-phosphatidyltransferase